MSQNRKLLKIVSLIQFPLGVALIVLGVLVFVGVLSDGSSHASLTASTNGASVQLSLGSGVVTLAAGLLCTMASVLGIRGANRPRSLGSHGLIAILGAISGACTTGICILAHVQDTLAESAFIMNINLMGLGTLLFILSIAAAILDKRVKGEITL
ncbi:hypothetical protein K6V98_04885 [Collinsella sp. AGMB00827]|uniref:DUF4418 domain-containing protein n=1 Tax=Collinsella ureilytica TaxID=2869515 RepID=A0ABS7MMP0_9ACTN|nr:hypothetical protein [Collinsella urealyticum]MBY4797690.1 hypothetical protein [Collinsella urealyticum]